MDNKKQELPVNWMVAASLCFLVLAFLIHKFDQNLSESIKSIQSVVSPAQKNKAVESTSRASLQNHYIFYKETPGQIKNTAAVTLKNQATQKIPISKQAVNESQSSVTNQDNVQPNSAAANPVPTEDQIMASLDLQAAQLQARSQALSNRVERIGKVHQLIVDSGGQLASSGNVKEFQPPLLEPPKDVEQKIKSNQWTAH